MLVRDNAACPLCGKLAISDVFTVWSDDDRSSFILVAECTECLGGMEIVIPHGRLRYCLRDLARAFPLGNPLSAARRWTPWVGPHGFDYSALRFAAELLLERGELNPKLVEHPTLRLLSQLVWSSVHTGDRSPWNDSPLPLATL